jgi:apolipoprotein N-acyltransferase
VALDLEKALHGFQRHNPHAKALRQGAFLKDASTQEWYMKPLSKAGWITLLLGLLLLLGVFWHYNGFTDAAYAIGRMLVTLFYGGITWLGLFCLLMAVLFLNN